MRYLEFDVVKNKHNAGEGPLDIEVQVICAKNKRKQDVESFDCLLSSLVNLVSSGVSPKGILFLKTRFRPRVDTWFWYGQFDLKMACNHVTTNIITSIVIKIERIRFWSYMFTAVRIFLFRANEIVILKTGKYLLESRVKILPMIE